ncbi:MAG: ABC transporter substrate-binding protein [Candidatus Aminicenantia bacterium]
MRKLIILLILLLIFFSLNFCQREDNLSKQVIEFWTTEVEQDRLDIQNKIISQFEQKYPSVKIKLVPVDESSLNQKLFAAKAANLMPDIVEIGLEHLVGLADQEILNQELATEIISEIGPENFLTTPLNLAKDHEKNLFFGVPLDCWIQGIWYRKDLFQKYNLSSPKSWSDILKAARKLYHPEKEKFGILVGTDPQQVYTQQVFEHIALSNGARIFDLNGELKLNTSQLKQSFEFYSQLIQLSPPGRNSWREAREYYLTQRVFSIFYSSYLLDDLYQLGKNNPKIKDLALNTSFCPTLIGPQGKKVTYGQIYCLALIRTQKQRKDKKYEKIIIDWAKFLLSDGYPDWITMAPGGKVPVLKSFIPTWMNHPLFSFSPQIGEEIISGIERIKRWGFKEKKNHAFITEIYGKKIFPLAIGEIQSGKLIPSQTHLWIEKRINFLR